MEKLRKYKIDEYMKTLNLPSYKAALKAIPKQLEIAFNTFHNYRTLAIDSKADIPYNIVRKLEIIFEMEEGELANYTIECENLETLIKKELDN